MKRYIFGTILLLYGCSSKTPAHFIQLGQMRQILWQMSVADQVVEADTSKLVRLHVKDTVTRLYAQILKDNKVSETNYKKSLDYYMSDPELMKQLVDTTTSFAKKITDSFTVKYKPKLLIKPVDSTQKIDTVGKKKILLAGHISQSLPLHPNLKFGHKLPVIK